MESGSKGGSPLQVAVPPLVRSRCPSPASLAQMATSEVIASPDESLRCRERAVLRVCGSARMSPPRKEAIPSPWRRSPSSPPLLRVRARLETSIALRRLRPVVGAGTRTSPRLRTIRDALPLDASNTSRSQGHWPARRDHKDNCATSCGPIASCFDRSAGPVFPVPEPQGSAISSRIEASVLVT